MIEISAPSNIAFIKYWGKHGRQFPMNESLSMTLKNCYTDMEVEYWLSDDIAGVQNFLFENKNQETFKAKINRYLQSIQDVYPLARRLCLNIKSKNTFPHSAGIASSASAMAALGKALGIIEAEITGKKLEITRVSELARLASGSASRSVIPYYASWGKSTSIDQSSQNYAIAFKDFHHNFSEVGDSILIISDAEKPVSSTAGHQLMESHPFREARIEQARKNFKSLIQAMKEGDWRSFGAVLENEALTLHGLMMNSSPSFILLEAKTLDAIRLIREEREVDKELSLYFTIDAGPNLHLIYPLAQEKRVKRLIETKLKSLYKSVIHDQILTE